MAYSERWYNYWSAPAPWFFHGYPGQLGEIHAANNALIISGVSADVGALMAAAPTLYATLYQLSRALHPHDPRRALIIKALRRASPFGKIPVFRKDNRQP